jgi:hypothetical protein
MSINKAQGRIVSVLHQNYVSVLLYPFPDYLFLQWLKLLTRTVEQQLPLEKGAIQIQICNTTATKELQVTFISQEASESSSNYCNLYAFDMLKQPLTNPYGTVDANHLF